MVSKVTILAVIACVGYVCGSPILEAIHHPQPYKFGYSVKDHHGEQHREEASDGAGAVVGNYGFTDDRGIARQVNYVADHAGFRAQVKTNEPGTANQDPAAVHMVSSEPYLHGAAVPYVPEHVSPVVLAEPVLANVHGHGLGHHGAALVAHDNVHGHAGVYGLEHGVAPVYAHGAVPAYAHGAALGHHGQVLGLGHGAVYGLGHHGQVYGLNHAVHHGHHEGALAYSGLLGGGVVNYGAPLVGGAINGFDSRFANVL
ncbi:hypothetical protein JTE90_001905 [Oedothorax gibbosus]|uniref:Cuticle protein n=1 Tax=Oedothorax gibbosus TaxID=931172 RepID=A0AAV6VTL1_9ARAC|nr:hypothetical protein JTE90_001905 [Oedothorax gibbosus]